MNLQPENVGEKSFEGQVFQGHPSPRRLKMTINKFALSGKFREISGVMTLDIWMNTSFGLMAQFVLFSDGGVL